MCWCGGESQLLAIVGVGINSLCQCRNIGADLLTKGQFSFRITKNSRKRTGGSELGLVPSFDRTPDPGLVKVKN